MQDPLERVGAANQFCRYDFPLNIMHVGWFNLNQKTVARLLDNHEVYVRHSQVCAECMNVATFQDLLSCFCLLESILQKRA